MSHTADVAIEILDLEALKAACEPLGLEFMENQKHHKSYYSNESCEHAIRVKGAPSSTYEIGVVKNQNGRGWKLRADSYNNGYGLMEKIGGMTAPRLRQEYSLQLGARKVPRGFRMQRVVTNGGHVQLRFSR